jgi:hypothetical protein
VPWPRLTRCRTSRRFRLTEGAVVTRRRSPASQRMLSLARTDGVKGSGFTFLCQEASVSTAIASFSELPGQRTHTDTGGPADERTRRLAATCAAGPGIRSTPLRNALCTS